MNTIPLFQVVTKRESVDKFQIEKSAEQFVMQVKSLLSGYDKDFVLNTDQSGLRLEFPSTRTLSYRGEKTTLSAVRSINATTHSYTVQPMISMSGKIVGPVYLCLKEINGQMSDNIRANLPKVKNVIVSCSASGKLTTSLVKYWRDKCLLPSLSSHKALLISDSWSGQADRKDIYEPIRGLKRLEIPWKTTSIIQPLDVFFNRQWKVIVRKVYERVLLDEIDIHLAQRNNIIYLQSLIHNQLSSPVFTPMIRYAWFKCGYTDVNPGSFQTVIEVCFKLKQDHCDTYSCDQFSFIRCSYCNKILCLQCFFLNYHTHGI
jgi:hypothetical protein